MSYKKILFRRDTAANWVSENPVLSAGEIGLETDGNKIKLGNGSTAWNSLSYFYGTVEGVTLDNLGDVTITSAASGEFLRWNGSAWINDAINLGTDTVGNYMSNVTQGTGVTVTHTPGEASSATIAIGQSVGTSDSPSFAGVTADGIQIGISASLEIDTTAGNLTIDSAGGTVTIDDNLVVTGDFTVSGTTTTVNTETINLADNLIVLNSNESGAPSQNAGIEIERGSSTNVALRWNESNDKWELTEDGSAYANIATTSYVDAQSIAVLDDIGDVTITSASAGQFLKWNGSAWVNDEVPLINTLDDVGDVTITSASAGQFLKWNGSAWINDEVPLINTLDDVGDVTITSASAGQFLKWDGSAWVNDTIDLGADTAGSFVASLVAGTGVSVTNNSGEAATPTIAVDTTVIAPLASPTFTGTVSGVTKTMVGLGNVDNTSDANKPVSTAQQTALDLKAPLASPTFTGTVTLPDNTVALGTKTTGDYVATITGGTGVSSTAATSGEGTTHTLSIGQSVATNANPTFAGATLDAVQVGITAAGEIDTTTGNLTIDSAGGTVTVDDNLTVTGNLTVSGTTTSVNTETVTVDDNIIVLNNNEAGTPSQNAGIEIERGTSANVLVRWNETSDKWETTNDGTTYGNIVTTADSGTVTSTMIADGTIVNADVNASAAIALSKLASGTSAQVIVADSSGVPTYRTLSGDVTVSNTGVVSIAADSVALGTDTTGNYMVDVSAGTGISVTHTPGEGSTATIGLNAGIDALSDVTITSAANGQFLKWNGSAWVNDSIPTINTLDDVGDVTITTVSTGQIVQWNGSAWINSSSVRNNEIKFLMEVI